MLEEFTVADGSSLVDEIVRRFVNPGQDVGGDSRLQMPDARRIKSEATEIDGQVGSPAYKHLPNGSLSYRWLCKPNCFHHD